MLTNATVVDDAIRFVSFKSKENLKSPCNENEDDKEKLNEPNYDDQLEEEQKEATAELTTNQVF